MNLTLITQNAVLSQWRTTAATGPTAPHNQTAGELHAEELHATYAQCVFDYLLPRLDERAEAEDVTVEVFTEALRGWHRFRRAASPKTFLLSIARHKCADALRRRTRTRQRLLSTTDTAGMEWLSTLASPDAGPPELLQPREAAAQIRRLVFALPEMQREAILLQYADGLSIAEIAEILKKSPAAVNSLLQRARAALYQNGRDYFAPEENA